MRAGPAGVRRRVRQESRALQVVCGRKLTRGADSRRACAGLVCARGRQETRVPRARVGVGPRWGRETHAHGAGPGRAGTWRALMPAPLCARGRSALVCRCSPADTLCGSPTAGALRARLVSCGAGQGLAHCKPRPLQRLCQALALLIEARAPRSVDRGFSLQCRTQF